MRTRHISVSARSFGQDLNAVIVAVGDDQPFMQLSQRRSQCLQRASFDKLRLDNCFRAIETRPTSFRGDFPRFRNFET